MTTHDQHTETMSAAHAEPEFSSAREEFSAPVESAPLAQTEPPRAETAPQETAPEGAEAPATMPNEPESGQTETVPRSADVEPATDELLFAADPSALRSRWDDIQAAFVDDPAACVQKADTLVEEIIAQVTTGFADARSHLEEQWARGENASTEDLRVALTRYREFFQRLLAV
ncbi:hypothetical protein ACIA48_09785 [Mycobacterium sp. NPDC051804]|uniref:hypothetical protein n=1 Tax=Mycobacterium sp. NPDC051804 TaxID=3364295 RepID=UPI0037B5B301